jgi:hypothetical protein
MTSGSKGGLQKRRIFTAAIVLMAIIAGSAFLLPSWFSNDAVASPESDFEWFYTGKAWTLARYRGTDTHVVVPASRRYDYPVTRWLGGTFSRFTGIKTIPRTFPVTEIGGNAFFENKTLETVTLPPTIIRLSGFVRCTKLRDIHLEPGIRHLVDGAFSGCESLISITLPDSVETMGGSVFQQCVSLEHIRLPPAVKSVPPWTFHNCVALKSCEFASPIESIGDIAFYNCASLKGLDFKPGLVSIGKTAFSDCISLETVDLPATVTSVGDMAFIDCKNLKSVRIPNPAAILGDGAFSSCRSLESVEIANPAIKVGSIQYFSNCPKLEKDN